MLLHTLFEFLLILHLHLILIYDRLMYLCTLLHGIVLFIFCLPLVVVLFINNLMVLISTVNFFYLISSSIVFLGWCWLLLFSLGAFEVAWLLFFFHFYKQVRMLKRKIGSISVSDAIYISY